jgi:hypothetical protein
MEVYRLKKQLTDEQADKLKGKYLNEKNYDVLITEDADGYDINGNLLFRFRKNAIPLETLKLGVLGSRSIYFPLKALKMMEGQ